jgi:type II secretory pathway component HofQ
MTRRSTLVFFTLLLLMLAGAARAQEINVEIIELRYRSAEEMLPILQPLVEPPGSVGALQNKLIIRGTPAGLRQIKSLVAQLDTAPRQLLITVDQGTLSQTRERASGISGHAASGDVEVFIPSDVPPGTPGIAVGGRDGAIEARSGIRRGSSDSGGQQQLRVLDGREAVIYLGQSVPFARKSKGPGGALIEDIEYRDVMVGFSVLPRVQGDQVTLEISPQQESISGAGGTISVQRSSTSVSGRLGEWIDIGGATQEQVSENRSLSSSRSSRRQDTHQVRVKVEELP